MVSEKKKILYVITKSEPFGGAQRYVYDLATNVSKDPFDTAVAFGGSGLLKEKLDAKNVRTVVMPQLQRDIHVLKEYKVFLSLIHLFKKERPDIVHLNSSKAGGLGALAARLTGIPKIVFTAHGLPFEESRRWLAQIALRFLTWLTFLLCHDVIVISKSNLATAQSFVGIRHKLHHIHNGIKAPDFLKRDEAIERLRSYAKNDSFSNKTFLVGTIAELHPNKGLGYAIRAFKKIHKQHKRTQFLIIGTGDDREKLEDEIERNNLTWAVSLLGYIPDAAQYLKALDVFVLPSVKEGHPYVLLEAGHAELPVVTTNISGSTDIISDMESGMLVRAKDEYELAKAMLYLIDNPKQRKLFGKKLSEQTTKMFSLDTMIHRTVSVYENK